MRFFCSVTSNFMKQLSVGEIWVIISWVRLDPCSQATVIHIWLQNKPSLLAREVKDVFCVHVIAGHI